MSNQPSATRKHILSINAGSSSLKLALFAMENGQEQILIDGAVEEIASVKGRLWLHARNQAQHTELGEFPNHARALDVLLRRFADHGTPPPDAVGHRVVHGGLEYQVPVRITANVVAKIHNLVHLAPLHLPANLAGIEAVSSKSPELPQVACFDTAFHSQLPEIAQRLPLSKPLWKEGLRRYGFHGLSYEYVLAETPEAQQGRTIIAHLGNGASLVAIRDGRPLDTTMGLTPTGGVMMGTRSGDLDPGVLIYFMRSHKADADTVERLVNREAGLLGVSGVSSNMQTLLSRRDDPRCQLAVDLFVSGIRKAIGSLTTVLSGLDTLIFTGGIGEHAEIVRSGICENLEHLGVQIDPERNQRPERRISANDACCQVLVIPTNEQLMIARQTLRVIWGNPYE